MRDKRILIVLSLGVAAILILAGVGYYFLFSAMFPSGFWAAPSKNNDANLKAGNSSSQGKPAPIITPVVSHPAEPEI